MTLDDVACIETNHLPRQTIDPRHGMSLYVKRREALDSQLLPGLRCSAGSAGPIRLQSHESKTGPLVCFARLPGLARTVQAATVPAMYL